MGRFELPGFAAGTHAIARAVGALTAAGATTVVGGECAVVGVSGGLGGGRHTRHCTRCGGADSGRGHDRGGR
jgi:3-phosphoglycerate kinase